jgi:hypothetical protein
MKPNIKEDMDIVLPVVELNIKKEHKKLRRKLTARVGDKPRTHDMDDEMYETINKMLQSSIRADVEIAMGIVFDSNISTNHIDKLITEHRNLLLYGHSEWSFYADGMERMTIHSNGNVGLGTTIPQVNAQVSA